MAPSVPTAPAGPGRRIVGTLGRPAGALLVLLTAVLLAYGRSLSGEFLWDDHFLVEHNPFIRSPVLFGETFRHFLFHDSASTFYRPVQNLSYALDYLVWGMDPFGFRLTNLLLHALDGWLLCLLLRRLLPGLGVPAARVAGVALTVALIWAIHPVHSATVAYVAGRADSLAVGFALLAWLLYERGSRTSSAARAGWYAAAAGSWLLALGSKEMAAIWLALFAAHLLCFRPGIRWRHRAAALGVALICLGLYWAARQLPSTPPGVFIPAGPPLLQRWTLVCRALGDYGGLLLCPTRLCMERQVFSAYGAEYNPGLAGYYRVLTFVGPAFLVLLLLAAAWPGPARRLRVFGAGWFLVAVLPVSNVFALNASVAEHWLYVPGIGFGLLLAGLWLRLPGHWQRPAAALLLGLWAPLLLARTVVRAGDWTDRGVFVPRTIAHGGDSPRMRNMLAGNLAARGDLPGGEAILRGLVRQSPANATARMNLANNLRRQNRLPEASALYAELADPDAPRADSRTLPAALTACRELAEAGTPMPNTRTFEESLAAGLRRFPQSWELLSLRAETLRRAGRPEEALALARQRVQSSPWDYAGWMLLGDLSAEHRDPAAALDAYARASRLDIREVRSWLARAVVLTGLGRDEEARAMLQFARSRQGAVATPGG